MLAKTRFRLFAGLGAAIMMLLTLTGALAAGAEITKDDLETYANDLYVKYGAPIGIIYDYSENYGSDKILHPVTDYNEVWNALEKLDEMMGMLPPQFLEQLNDLTIETGRPLGIGFILGGEIEDHSDSLNRARAFVSYRYGGIEMVLNVSNFDEATFFHELSHMIDKSLAKKIPTFEADWEKMNPNDFEYAYTYTKQADFRDKVQRKAFASTYSMTFPTEDRAEVLGYASSGKDYIFQDGWPIKEKLKFYSDSIRSVYDTTGWPVETIWEKSLNTTAVLPEITTTKLPTAYAGQMFSVQLEAVGENPIAWYDMSDNSPEWLQLSTEGVLSGIPAVPGEYEVTVWAENEYTGDWMDYVLRVENPSASPEVPATGDQSHPFLWVILIVLSVIVIQKIKCSVV